MNKIKKYIKMNKKNQIQQKKYGTHIRYISSPMSYLMSHSLLTGS